MRSRNYETQNARLDAKIKTATNGNATKVAEARKIFRATLQTTDLLLDYDLAALDPDQLQDLLDDIYKMTQPRGSIDPDCVWSGIGVSNRKHVLISRRLLVWDDRCGRHYRYAADGQPCQEAEGMRAAGLRTFHLLSAWRGAPLAPRR